jgi:hypothetical protein
MKYAAFCIALATLALAACERPSPEAAQPATEKAPAPAAAAPTAEAPAKAKARRLTAEEIASIGASGKTGSGPIPPTSAAIAQASRRHDAGMECPGDRQQDRRGLPAGRTGKVRRVTNGEAIGGKPVGGWVRPGTTFVLRAPNSSQDLGKVVIGKKDC